MLFLSSLCLIQFNVCKPIGIQNAFGFFTIDKSDTYKIYIYRPQRSCGQCNIFTPICHSFCSQGGGLPQCMLGYPPPRSRHPPRADPPWTRPPRADTPRSRHPPPKQTPAYGLRAAGTHPTGMHSCLKVRVIQDD